MEIAKSNIVRSDAGRDKGKLFVVLAVEGEYLLLADGKSRKLESPKRKKRRRRPGFLKRSRAMRRSPTVNFAGLSRLSAKRSNRTRRDNVWQNPI